MEDTSPGFSSPAALVVIFSFLVIVMSLSVLFSTEIIKVERIQQFYRKEKGAEEILQKVLEDFQVLKDSENDWEFCEELSELRRKYRENNLEIRDVSTGINETFLSEEIRKALNEEQLIEVYGQDIIRSYGWINEKYADTGFLSELYSEHTTEELFPLVCCFPMNNVNFMEQGFLESVLKHSGIKDADKKALIIEERKEYGITEEILLQILNCKKDSSVFDFIGVKTAFWRITLKADDIEIDAVIAAIPDRENQRKVNEYVLLEEHIERGCLNK